MKTRDSRFALLVTVPIALFLIAWSMYPMAYSLWIAFNQYTIHGGHLAGGWVGLANFATAINSAQVQNSFERTFEYVAIALPLSVLLALGIALLINEVLPGSSFIKMIALLPWAVSDYGTGELWRWVYAEGYGVINTIGIDLHLVSGPVDFVTPTLAIPEIAFAEAWHLAPLGAFFLLASLQVIPESLYRQARIDGANILKRFRAVTYPYIRYALLITVVITTVFTMEVLDEILTITGGGPGFATELATVQVYELAFVSYNFGESAAVSWLLLAMVAVMATLWFRLIIRRH